MKIQQTIRKTITPIPYIGKGAVLFCVKDSPGLIVESHHHLYHEFDYIIKGRGEYAIGGRKFDVKAGDIVYIGRGIQHRRASDISDPLVMCNLDIEDSMLTASGDKKLIWPLWKKWDFDSIEEKKLAYAVKTLLRLMPEKIEKGRRLQGRQWQKISNGLVSVLNNEWTMIAKISPGLHDLAMRIRTCPEKYLSLEEEANQIGFSRYWLSRKFHAVFGVTMFEYRDLARTDKAMRFLLDRKEPVSKLWKELGYSSKAHFINTFRRFAGCTPGIFRCTL